jgi:hypothetical protein
VDLRRHLPRSPLCRILMGESNLHSLCPIDVAEIHGSGGRTIEFQVISISDGIAGIGLRSCQGR